MFKDSGDWWLAMVELTRKHMAWVHAVRIRYFPHIPERYIDDLVGAGMVGLVKAARAYDPSRGSKFATYADRRIHGAMQDHLRAVNHTKRKATDQNGNPIDMRPAFPVEDWNWIEAQVGEYAPMHEFELTESLYAALNILSEREQCVIRLHYLKGWGQAEVGELLDIGPARVCQIASEACAKLRSVLDREALAA